MSDNGIISSLLKWTPLFNSVKCEPAPQPTFSFTNLNFLYGIGCGVVIGIVLHRVVSKRKKDEVESQTDKIYNDFGADVKMVLVVRNDLKMGKGKVAAQCAHAALKGYRLAEKFNPELLMSWLENGEPKVVLKAETDNDLSELRRAAQEQGLFAAVIRDAGRTQIAPNSRTVLGIGPGPSSVIDTVTGHLRLY